MGDNTIMAFGYVFILILTGLAIALLWMTILHLGKAIIFARRIYASYDSLRVNKLHKVLWYAFWFDADSVSIGGGPNVYFPGREPRP